MQALAGMDDATLQMVRDLVLPPRGAEFEIAYLDGSEEIPGEQVFTRPHSSVSAVSAGLKVTVIGGGTRVVQNRQRKPWVSDEIYRTMLVIEVDGVFVHILGDHVVVARERFNVGQLAPGG